MDELIYEKQRELQDKHWWFKGRRELIADFLKRTVRKAGLILDVGSGSGGMIGALKPLGRVEAVEMNKKLHPDLKKAGVKTIYINDIIRKAPSKKYDLVSLFDVLEHIKEDKKALELINKKLLKSGGRLVITVPAYQWLWTSHDDLSHHFRRYTRSGLVKKIRSAGFHVEHSSYFMSLLFPFGMLSRLWMRLTRSPKTDLSMPSPFMNSLMYKIFLLEKGFLRSMGFPFGLSVLVLARKD